MFGHNVTLTPKLPPGLLLSNMRQKLGRSLGMRLMATGSNRNGIKMVAMLIHISTEVSLHGMGYKECCCHDQEGQCQPV